MDLLKLDTSRPVEVHPCIASGKKIIVVIIYFRYIYTLFLMRPKMKSFISSLRHAKSCMSDNNLYIVTHVVHLIYF